ncbi:MAG: hypothetical protein K6F57_01300, partial [Candidatus Saccharibacteria bacterium]|nr:hypothetical protein [Candidatus Saccharibacteria bacterium]
MSEIKKVTTDTTETPVESTDTTIVADVKTVSTDPVDSPDAALVSKIKEYGGNDAAVDKIRDLGVETVDDLRELTESDLTSAGLKLVKARKLLAELNNVAKKEATAAVAAATPIMSSDYNMILPSPSTDESFLKALRAGGVLKVDDSSYEAALRVFLADRCGLYAVPDKLSTAMLNYADGSDAPVSSTFFALIDSITRRNYGDLFSAIPGLTGAFVSKKRRDEFVHRISSEMCPAIREAYVVLDAWYKSMLAASSNPAALVQAISGVMSGAGVGLGASLPPTDAVHDAADTLKDAINHVFRGTAAPVGAAMAKDAMEIASVL